MLAPLTARSFWPLFSAQAQNNGEPPIIHDASMDLLVAATNSDPNPQKRGTDIEITGGSALMANAGPDGSLPPSSGASTGGSISLYEVREGDSLSAIAQMFGVTTNTILWANDIKDAKTIRPGDTLLILPVSGVQHKIVKGETLAGIAKKYDADVDDVALYNGISLAEALTAGDTLIIPGGDLNRNQSTGTSGKKTGTGSASTPLPALNGYYGNPVPGARLTQGLHGFNGVDLGAPAGTPVYAAAAGTVIVAKASGYNGGYGNYIVIKHDNGTQTLYGHLSSVSVSVGDTLEKGARIGGVGSTGRSTGNHLHFEVRGAKNPFAR